jgi:hypothetical protein
VGEYLYAKHSIEYSLPQEKLFQVIMIIEDQKRILSWSETVEYAELLGIPTVPVIETLEHLYKGYIPKNYTTNFSAIHEGFVVRNIDSFLVKDFSVNIAKWVRQNHAQPNTEHWRTHWQTNIIKGE